VFFSGIVRLQGLKNQESYSQPLPYTSDLCSARYTCDVPPIHSIRKQSQGSLRVDFFGLFVRSIRSGFVIQRHGREKIRFGSVTHLMKMLGIANRGSRFVGWTTQTTTPKEPKLTQGRGPFVSIWTPNTVAATKARTRGGSGILCRMADSQCLSYSKPVALAGTWMTKTAEGESRETMTAHVANRHTMRQSSASRRLSQQ
jgi:hypothetical protein